MVGRVHEWAQLERHMAGDGPPMLMLAGEPGIGKSRLLREAAARARMVGWTVLEGGCQRRSGQPPFAPLLDALAQHLASRSQAQLRTDLQGASWLVRLLPELAGMAVVPTPRWTLPPEQERRLMFVAVARYLANVAGPAGTLLVLDDLQWAGADALDLLGSLIAVARAASGPPLLLLGAYRSTEVRADHPLSDLLADLGRDGLVDDLPVGPLTSAEARSLLESLLGDGDTARHAELIDQLLQRAGGIPFYLASCARAAQAGAERAAQLDLTAALDAVPWDAAQSIRQRIALLPAGASELLGAAAIAGRGLERRVLEALIAWLNLDRNAAALVMAAAVQARLLLEADGDAYRFAHDLIREVAAADLGTWRRHAAHRVIAEALEASLGEQERDLRAAELALHFARGGEIPRALPYLERAGELAQARYANVEAEQIYRDLLRHYEELGRPLDAARTAERLGKVLVTVARDDEAIALLTQAARAYRDAGDADSYARTMALVGRAHSTSGGIDAGILTLESVAHSMHPDQPSRGAMAVHTGLMMLYWSAARYREQASAAQRAAEIAHTLGNAREVAWAESLHHAALLMLGHLAQSIQPLESALPTIEDQGDVDTLGWMVVQLGESYAYFGRFDQFLFHMEHAGEMAELIGNPLNISYVCYWLGLHAFCTGDWRRAYRYFEQGCKVAQPVATAEVSGSAAGYALLGMGRLSLARGEDELGGRYLEEALTLARSGLPPRLLRPVQACLAERDLLAGHPGDALGRLGPLLEVPEGREGIDATPLLPLLAWAHLEASDRHRAVAVAAEALDRCYREQHQLALLDALRVQALLEIRQERWDEAAAALDEALALARPMPFPYAEAKALYVYGHLHHAKGEPLRARACYEQGLAICNRLGERLYAERIERALVELGGARTIEACPD
jgi:tetratricopeptide (TPR) repeat protein